MSVSLHPAMTHAQAQRVLHEMGAQLRQDGRGNLRVVTFKTCDHCHSPICSEMQFCARPTEPEAA